MLAPVFLAPVRTGGLPRASNGTARKHARTISSSASSKKALPFSLNSNLNSAVHAAKDDLQSGRTLRLIMFGKPGAGKVSSLHTSLSSVLCILTF